MPWLKDPLEAIGRALPAIENAVRRAVDGFWHVARAEGFDWIRDPALKGLAMVRLAKVGSQGQRRPSA
jgi:hypothetical protein